MYRQNSFSSKASSINSNLNNHSILRQNSSASQSHLHDDRPSSGMEVDSDHLIHLKASGSIVKNKFSMFATGGLMVAFKHYSTRHKSTALTQVCYNHKASSFALSDERGQIYNMLISADANRYESIRSASTAVSAMCFLAVHRNHLVVAYESGSIIIVDVSSKEMVGTLQPTKKNKASPTRLIVSHPLELRVITVSDSKCLYIWDLGTCTCINQMECEEAIVDVRYELDGQVVALTLENSGVYFYGTTEGSDDDDVPDLLMHLQLPQSEPSPQWTAYCSYSVFVASNAAAAAPLKISDAAALNVILAGNNDLLYSWHVSVGQLLLAQHDTPQQQQLELIDGIPVGPYHLVGVIELPLKTRTVTSMQLMNGTDYPPRLCVLFQEGGLLLIDIEGFQLRSVGHYMIRADLSPQTVHGPEATAVTGWQYTAIGGNNNNSSTSSSISRRKGAWTNTAYLAQNTSSSSSLSHNASSSSHHQSVWGKLYVVRNSFVVIGCDGVARWFDTRAAVGDVPTNSSSIDSLSGLCNTCLRSRVPRSSSSSSSSSSAAIALSLHEADSRRRSSTNASDASTAPAAAIARHASQVITDSDRSNEHSPESKYDFILLNGSDDLNGNMSRSGKTRGVGGVRSTKASRALLEKRRGDDEKEKEKNKSSIRANYAAMKKHTQSFLANQQQSSSSSSRAEDSSFSMPLFELAALTPKEKQVNDKKLRSFLQLHGEFPGRYRPLIWRFLLRLPENSMCFKSLVLKGPHEGYESLYDKYPIRNRSIFIRLQNLCSALAHWAPILGEAEYLPALVFPFTLVFGSDELSALELSMSVLMWWGHSWHATHPSPPVHITDTFDALLKFYDSKLHAHMRRLEVAPGLVCWTMLSTLFTEVLSRIQWLRLMDSLICYFEKPQLVMLVPIVLLKELKGTILAADTSAQIKLFCRTQQRVNMTGMMKTLFEYLRNTPSKYFSSVVSASSSRDKLHLGPNQVVEDNHLTDVDEARENLALSTGKPMFPLPKGVYPIYDGYPTSLMNLQIRERNKILALSKEISRKESVLNSLQAALEQVQLDHHQWMTKHKHASDAELRHQYDMMEREKRHLSDLLKIEEEISTQRLNTLNALEVAARDEMVLMDSAAAEAAELMKRSEQHMKEKMDVAVSLQRHRELAEMAEVATFERLKQLQIKRIREDWVRGVSTSLKSREDELASKDAVLNQQWKKEDDQQRLRRDQRMKELKAMDDHGRMTAVQEDISTRMQRLELERDAKIVEIERSRALRLAKEQAEEALESAERSAMALRQHDLHNEQEQLSKIREDSVHQAGHHLMDTVRMLETESRKLLEAERVHVLRQNKARAQARQAKLREEWAEKSSDQLKSILSVQGELQEQMLKLQQAALRSEAEENYAQSGLIDKQLEETKRELQRMEQHLMQQQQQRFEDLHHHHVVGMDEEDKQRPFSKNTSAEQRMANNATQTTIAVNRADDRHLSQTAHRRGDEYSNNSSSNSYRSSSSSSSNTGNYTASKREYRRNDNYATRNAMGPDPDSMRLPSDIPAPFMGGAVGYGIAVPTRERPAASNDDDDDDDDSGSSDAAPFEDAHYIIRGLVGKEASSSKQKQQQQKQRTDDDMESDDDIRLPPTFQYNSRQSTRDTTQSRTLKATSTRGVYDRPPIWKDNYTSSSPLSTDSSSYRPTKTSNNLRQLAEQSLQCLDSTRTLNREEQLQERLGLKTGGVSMGGLKTGGVSMGGLNTGGVSMSMGGPARRPSTGAASVIPPVTGDVATIDSDTALWAFADETDTDMGD